MNISLTPELEQFVQDKVKSGMYTSASEVVRESLRILTIYENIQQTRIAQLNRAIDKGLEEVQSGDVEDANDVYEFLKNKIKSIEQNKK